MMHNVILRILMTISLTIAILTFKANISSAEGPGDFSHLAEILSPSVVNISTTQKQQAAPQMLFRRSEIMPEGPFDHNTPFDDFFDFFEKFGLMPMPDDNRQESRQKLVSLGSGFIIDPAGYIATNYHVIAEAEEINVTLNNEKQLQAKLVGYDAKTDLALLKVTSDKPLPAVKFGHSDEAKVGEWVLTIGNPFGFGGSVTAGIISAIARDINAGGLVDNFIQTDAAINKGNSGGPMFNMKGEVIGVNTAIFSPTGGNVGVGFAIPSSIADVVLGQLKSQGKVERAWLGVKIQPIDDEISDSLGLKDDKGVLVAEITRDSPADKAGIKPGDIILSFNGKDVTNSRKLPRVVAEAPLGKKIDVIILSKGKEKKLQVELAEIKEKADERIEHPLENPNKNKHHQEFFGAAVAKIDDNIRRSFGIDPKIEGIIVLNVARNSEWGKRGLQKGDIFIGIGQDKLETVEELSKVITSLQKAGKKSIVMLVARNGQTIFMPLPIKEK